MEVINIEYDWLKSWELLHNTELKIPPQFGTFKQAQWVQQAEAEQAEFGLSSG